jgi:hypothetical protein
MMNNYKNILKMKNNKYLMLGLLFILFSTISCVTDEVFETEEPTVGTSTVKLNEIMSTGSPDWLELYNGGTEAIDLSGYKLADSSHEWTIDNLSIEAGGYVTFDCDDSNIPNVATNFKISSGGEEITLYNATGELIDQITTPDMSSQTGLTYGRENDGSDNWVVMGASKGAANSNNNNPPLITADELTEFDSIYEIAVSDADGINSVKLVLTTDTSVQSFDMALIDGDYKVSVPSFEVGTQVHYFVKATDNTGLVSYFPETAPDTPNSYYVTEGNAIFLSVDYEGADGNNLGDVTFTVEAYDNVEVTEVKLYYVLPGFTIDDKVSVVLDYADGVWTGVIPAQPEESIIKYYLRAKNDAGNKTYYPMEGDDFDHDILSTWPTYMAGEPVVINGFSLFTNSNPVSGNDLDFNVHIAYENGDVTQVKLYYVVNYDATTYDGSQRVTLEWDGDLPTDDDFYNFTIPSTEFSSGDTIIWYMRAKDADGTKHYFTRGQDENFDKDIIEDWDEITIM